MSQTIFYTTNGRLDAESVRPIDEMLARLAAAEDPRLLLFVHGGLVPERVGVGTAVSLASELAPLANAGWETGFPIWRSGIGETIEINQDALSREPRFVRIVLRLAAWVDRKMGGGFIDKALVGAGDAEGALAALEAKPQPDPGELEALLSADDLERARNVEGLSDQHLEDTDLADEVMADGELVAMLDADLPMMDREVRARATAARQVPMPQSSSKLNGMNPAAWVIALLVVRVGYRVLNRCLHDRDHGVGPTIVEEVMGALYLDQAGAAAWSFMKDDARQHFDATGAGTHLLEGLSKIARGGKHVRLLTVGHSAGSLFAAHLAREAVRAPANMRFDFLLLAPAIRLDEAAAQFGQGRLDGFRIFTMHDSLESANHLDGNAFGKLYHRSLLYLISGVLERGPRRRYADAPLLGLERHLKPAYRATRDERTALAAANIVLGAAPDRVIYARSAPPAAPGRTSASEVHGGFWHDPKTLDSIRWVAEHGFSG
jgi:hypothetical protein